MMGFHGAVLNMYGSTFQVILGLMFIEDPVLLPICCYERFQTAEYI